MAGTVCFDLVNRVARLTINRPDKRNAVSVEMWRQLRRHVKSIAQAPGLAAVVLQGAGGSFSAGADLTEMEATDRQQVASYRRLGETTVMALARLEPPKLALIDGPCFGAGCSLALACDVRICSPTSRFGIPALAHGFAYEPTFVQQLVGAVGPGPAGLLLYGGEQWSAEDALAHGLVDKCASDVSSAAEQILASVRGADVAAVTSTAAAIRTANR